MGQNETESIVALWEGPIGIGNLPTTRSDFEKLKGSGIYVSVQRYQKKMVAYAGKARRRQNGVIGRIHEHIGNFLGLRYCLRTKEGDIFPSKEEGLLGAVIRQNELQDNSCESYALALEEAKNIKFFYWLIDPDCEALLNSFEHLAISRLKEGAKAGLFECDNTRIEKYGSGPPSLQIQNTIEHSDLKRILGSEPFIYPPG